MNTNHIVMLTLLILQTACPISAFANIDSHAKDWQKQSLKGITSVKYGVAYDPTKELTKTVGTGLTSIKIPTKSVNVKDDKATPLSSTEARLKVFVDDRPKGESWVGLSIEQKSHVSRDPSITFDSETYAIGTLTSHSKAKIDAAVKDLCTEFVKDFNAQTNK